MAAVDAALRSGYAASDTEADWLVRSMARAELRIGLPDKAIVTHTIVKVRQEPKEAKAGIPYIGNVAYREFVHFAGDLSAAFNLTTLSARLAETLVALMPLVTYFGKRGSFVQYLGVERLLELDTRFTLPLDQLETIPQGVHFAMLDDFGPEANFDALNSYSRTPIKRDKHRTFTQTVVPLGLVRSGPGFSEYRRFGEV
ncbi:MAG: hypothetical protein SFV18_15365 [Bryobacteraceae bacterium]|nr:hypothetical protein [Bryobacteraceae bacterium]